MSRNIELLAPVGNKESLYAAISNGANAVYLGGKLFNARHYASNFDYDELEEIVKYSHMNNVKVYITGNILIDNSEVKDILDYIRFLYEIDVDGLIVQDLGVASLVRELFPDFNIHGSTQMTINNLEGAKFLEEEGFTRVVLARETPIEEIKRIKENSSIELEGFVHGALCVAYSGQCLMSSLIGGRSGNRGQCAQPCRMKYSIVDKEGKLLNNWDKKYILSTKDLNTLEYIEEIQDAGITSFKIEGRMKRPEYVATIVKSYRKALDNNSNVIDSKDKKDIRQIFNRDFTKGLGLKDFGNSFISYDRPDNRGIVLGQVIKVNKGNTSILLKEDLDINDGVEFRLSNGEYKGLRSNISGKKDTIIKLDIDGDILDKSLVYKTSSSKLLEEAENSYKGTKGKEAIDMEIDIQLDRESQLKLYYKDIVIHTIGDFKAEKSKSISLSNEKIKEQLEKLGDTNYHLENLKINLKGEVFLPLSEINKLRRDAIEKLENKLSNFNNRKDLDKDVYIKKRDNLLNIKKSKIGNKKKLSILVNTKEQYNQLNIDKLDRIYLNFYENLDSIIEELKEKNKEIYIYTDRILYNKDFKDMDNIIKPLEDKIDGISVSNIGSLKYFKDNYNLKIHGDIGLNIFNIYTGEYLKSLGVDILTLSLELNLKQIREIGKTNNNLETIAYGYIPAMITRTCPMALAKDCKDDSKCGDCKFAKGYGLKDRMNMVFYMNRGNGFTTIYNSVPLMVLDNLKSILESGVDNIRLDFNLENKDINEIQSIYYDYINNNISHKDAKEFVNSFRKSNDITKGHYYRGII